MKKIKKDFTLLAILLIPVSVAINIVGFQICQLLRLPIFLDSIGTILAGAIAGPWVGMATGILTNLVNGIFNPIFLAYMPTSIFIGLITGFLARNNFFKNIFTLLILGLVLSVVSAVSSGIITAIVFAGATGTTGSIATGVLLAAGNNIMVSVFSVQIIQELADKFLAVIIVKLVISSMSIRYLSKMKNGMKFIKKEDLYE
ncbi:ABC transporter permease [Companilactobacillus sp. RD055328]|uniref:ECF transporter S component n=1 Tax=Companilactobacillus sp. RD055328 TaxID=2916634 RepID=UPI001FC83218|nr:ECF transporter S component [Companilactobacillus sp. RD055328]GKQ43437.1 ABC transporter permease [Companilactobacillus sp. RD055328]